MAYLWVYLFKFHDHGVDFHQTKSHRYIYDILELIGGQLGQRARPLYGIGKVRKGI